jgi:type II secretory pathway component PulC
MRHQIQLIVLAVLLLAVSARAESTYRVSGIVGQENRWLFAVVEDSQGNCRIYSKGDALGSGRVVDVVPQGVLLEEAGEVRLLKLEGSSFITRIGQTSTEPERPPPVGTALMVQGKLPRKELQYAVENVVAELERDKQKPLEPQILTAFLGLPPGAQITAVSERPVKSPLEAMKSIQKALSNNQPLDFIIAIGDDYTKIYYSFDEPSEHPHQ